MITDSVLKLSDYGYYSALALKAGVPLHRLRALRHAANLVHALPRLDQENRIGIVDVGAHRGEWGLACAAIFPNARVISFEPVSEFCEDARRRASRFSNWKVLQTALGDQPGELMMEIRGQRSSFRHVAGEEFEEWRIGSEPLSRTERVAVRTLDDVLCEEKLSSVDLLKIDAEGYEGEILGGAGETLKRTKQILIEVRFYPLFEAGAVFQDVHRRLDDQGFELFHLKPCKGQCLWADALYVRKGC